MTDKEKNLAVYRLEQTKTSYKSAQLCVDNGLYKDSINRSYYVAFYAIKTVLAFESVDFKRHNDAVGYFNKTYVATEIFPKEFGKRLSRLKIKREASDYNDFFVASAEEAQEQLETAEYALKLVEKYLREKNILF